MYFDMCCCCCGGGKGVARRQAQPWLLPCASLLALFAPYTAAPIIHSAGKQKCAGQTMLPCTMVSGAEAFKASVCGSGFVVGSRAAGATWKWCIVMTYPVEMGWKCKSIHMRRCMHPCSSIPAKTTSQRLVQLPGESGEKFSIRQECGLVPALAMRRPSALREVAGSGANPAASTIVRRRRHASACSHHVRLLRNATPMVALALMMMTGCGFCVADGAVPFHTCPTASPASFTSRAFFPAIVTPEPLLLPLRGGGAPSREEMTEEDGGVESGRYVPGTMQNEVSMDE